MEDKVGDSRAKMLRGHISSSIFLSVRLRFWGRQLRKKGLAVNSTQGREEKEERSGSNSWAMQEATGSEHEHR